MFLSNIISGLLLSLPGPSSDSSFQRHLGKLKIVIYEEFFF